MSSMPPTPRSYPFVIANAFTQDPFGGNPAAIVFLDLLSTLTQEELLKIANGFNQPILVFLTPSSTLEKPGVVSFEIRYFNASKGEIGLCGHGTLAAAKVIFDSATNSPEFGQGNQFPAFSSPETHTVEFAVARGLVISARKIAIEEEGWFEIILPAGKLAELPAEEEERVLGIITRAMGKEPRVRYIGRGKPPFGLVFLLLVLEESENLEQLTFADISALKDTGYSGHIVTTDSTSGKFPENYITRLFAPAIGLDEDHVCGSANCIAGPYWAAQKGIAELKARQVSERGGQLRVGVYGDNIKIRGQVKVTGVGQLFL